MCSNLVIIKRTHTHIWVELPSGAAQTYCGSCAIEKKMSLCYNTNFVMNQKLRKSKRIKAKDDFKKN